MGLRITPRRLLLPCLIVPCGLAALSFAGFLLQGGFGGGHGRNDGIIVLPALPWWILLRSEAPFSLFDSDLVNWILVPLVLNLVASLAMGSALHGALGLFHRCLRSGDDGP